MSTCCAIVTVTRTTYCGSIKNHKIQLWSSVATNFLGVRRFAGSWFEVEAVPLHARNSAAIGRWLWSGLIGFGRWHCKCMLNTFLSSLGVNTHVDQEESPAAPILRHYDTWAFAIPRWRTKTLAAIPVDRSGNRRSSRPDLRGDFSISTGKALAAVVH